MKLKIKLAKILKKNHNLEKRFTIFQSFHFEKKHAFEKKKKSEKKTKRRRKEKKEKKMKKGKKPDNNHVKTENQKTNTTKKWLGSFWILPKTRGASDKIEL